MVVHIVVWLCPGLFEQHFVKGLVGGTATFQDAHIDAIRQGSFIDAASQASRLNFADTFFGDNFGLILVPQLFPTQALGLKGPMADKAPVPIKDLGGPPGGQTASFAGIFLGRLAGLIGQGGQFVGSHETGFVQTQQGSG